MVSVEDWQLLSFFEVEPQFPHPVDSWPYGDAVYRIDRNGLTLTFSINPACRQISILLDRGSERLYALSPLYVRDVNLWKDCGFEALRVHISDGQTLWLRVRPHIELSHKFENFNC